MTLAMVLIFVAGCGASDPDQPVPSSPGPTGSATATAPSPELPGPGFHQLTLDSGGEQREYLLDAPEDYRPEEPTALVVALHAGRSDAEEIRDRSGLAEYARRHGILVAYPQGEGGWWRPVVDGEHGVGVEFGGDPVDVEFLRSLVAELVAEWNVAPGQVYATGHSNGAAMTYRLAAEAADVFAAVAPVGGYLFDPPDSIDPAEPVSVVGFVGGSSRYTDEIAEGLDIWRGLLDCPPGDPEPVGDDARVTRTVATCRDGSEVVQYDIVSMGHVWPDESSHGIDANETMGDFFADHARPSG